MPEEILKRVIKKSRKLKKEQNNCWTSILIELKKQGIEIINKEKSSKVNSRWLESYFSKEIFPLLTPVAVDPAHPFPFVPNLGLCIVLKLKKTLA